MEYNYTEYFKKAKIASKKLAIFTDSEIENILNQVADAIIGNSTFILNENSKDLKRMEPSDPRYDRLKLNHSRLEAISADVRNVAILSTPLKRIISDVTRPNGLKIKRVTCPMGVVGVIYEARPNVTIDLFSLCLKSGNALVLKGGSDAYDSNKAIVTVIQQVLSLNKMDNSVITLLPADRQATAELLKAIEYVDLIIPRGSQSLIEFVRKNSVIPIIETGAGICHTYFDTDGELEMGRKIVNNAKTRRVSVCNALDCLLVHRSRLKDLSYLVGLLKNSDVEIFADSDSFEELSGHYPEQLLHPATSDSFGTEFLSYKMALKCVSSLEEALEHIEKYSSKHSEAIISQNKETVAKFFASVDASTLYANSSTAFTDGAQFGLGAEVGISTQKLHARGPMALDALTTYKWIVEGEGQIRE